MLGRGSICFLLFVSVVSMAGPREILPSATDPGITVVKSPHLVWTPSPSAANGQLLVSIGGTNSSTVEFSAFDELAASLGYFVIALDYPNGVISTVCRESADRSCFDHFRENIVLGAPVSSLVQVDGKNCILGRLQRLLEYLKAQDPQGGWGKFLKDGKIDWEKIAVAGHSQGSGHAAFLAKHFPAREAILIAGPQDHFVAGLAPWLSGASQTSPSRYFGLVHAQDPFDSHMQVEDLQALMQTDHPVTVDPEHLRPGAQIVISAHPSKDPHNSLLKSDYSAVWKLFLQ